jgi:hypothetical protein
VSSSWPIPCHLRVRMFRWQSSCRQREQRGAKGACLAKAWRYGLNMGMEDQQALQQRCLIHDPAK